MSRRAMTIMLRFGSLRCVPAEALVTLNVADFTAARHFRLSVLKPGAFLQQLREETN